MMKKKLFTLVLLTAALALVTAVSVGAIASAASDPAQSAPATGEGPDALPGQPRPRLGGVGQITAIEADQFTLRRLNGEEVTLLVDAQTRFLWHDGSLAALTDLAAERWVMGGAVKLEAGLVSRRVILFPDDFDPTLATRRAAGEVTALTENGFSLKTRRGEDLSVTVDAETVFLGQIQGLEGMATGQLAAVALQETDSGLAAVTLWAHERLIRHAGEITAVDLAAGEVTLESRQGERANSARSLSFLLDEATEIVGREGAVLTLADLQVGWVAAVAVSQLEDGSYQAAWMAAGPRPHIDLRALGRVTALDDVSVTLETRRGQTYTFQVDAATRFISRGRQVQSLADLQIGSRIGVAAQDLEDGQYLAVRIVSGRVDR